MTNTLRRIAVAIAIAGAASSAQAVAVVAVSPQGEVSQVRQVSVKFSAAVVPFGDSRLDDPFAVSCEGAAPAGNGHWVNDRAWVYDFAEALPPGTRCTVKLRPQWKPAPAGASALGVASSAGSTKSPMAPAALTGPSQFAFSTGGPAVIAARPGEGGEIEEDQHFLLRLSGPAVESTVMAHAW
ncbi:MAG: hypothetical protein M3Z16_11140, partial [Pseudomonadota bacterium]|nr:hypothetical protein [Pseudomonadota bacterium]